MGGVWRYARFLQALADPTHPDHKRQRKWAGGDFDPEEFEPARVNALIRQFLDYSPIGEDSR